MFKGELVEKIAKDFQLPKSNVELVLNAVIENIVIAVASGESVQLKGFGTFSQGNRSARIGLNPATGKAMQISAAKTARFSVGKEFKNKLNNA